MFCFRLNIFTMSSRRAKKAPVDLIDWEAVAIQDDECGGERGFKLKDKIRNNFFLRRAATRWWR